MSAEQALPIVSVEWLEEVIRQSCQIVAPAWPLDRQIAVNPWWGLTSRPFTEALADLRRLSGIRTALPLSEYRRAWNDGEISGAALQRAIDEFGAAIKPREAVDALEATPARPRGLPLLSDILDEHTELTSGPLWRDTITQQISQYCASYFDELQADWHRQHQEGLFSGWRISLQSDHALESLMHAPQIKARIRELPASADAAIEWALRRLDIPREEAGDFLRVCLLRMSGWASWCAFLAWECSFEGALDPHLRELLAIRASWEGLLHDGRRSSDRVWREWRSKWLAQCSRRESDDGQLAMIWQRAQELAYQDRLAGLLAGRGPAAPRPASSAVEAQLVFCIDVRSERLRRALESIDAGLETRGFAGFFGLPIRHRPIGSESGLALLPGLIAPSLESRDSSGDPRIDAQLAARRARARRTQSSWRAFTRSPSGAFSLVEALGIGYAAKIVRRHGAIDDDSDAGTKPPPALAGEADCRSRAALVAGILRSMSLTAGFARLLVLVGHGSQSSNNPVSASLDCGACGGHSGEVNARLLARMLNDTSIRDALRGHDIDIPRDTVAVAALHNTTTDEVTLFDLEQVPASHAQDLERLALNLECAAGMTRRERASSLGLAAFENRPYRLLAQLRRRARDWAETRPEWGLANNAAFIAAPRWRTRGLHLDGRVFLHDYEASADIDGSVLTGILAAPMVVAHWINLQYYASTVEPDLHGSGNKTLHNVACGHIGVFEGNTGDLRTGLARQSVHDGRRWMHAPLRLSVFVDAPRQRIDAVLAQQETVRRLVTNRWVHLFRFAEGGIEHLHEGEWRTWLAPDPLIAPGSSP